MTDEIKKLIEDYKAERPDVDWDTHAVYVITNQETGKVQRYGHARKDRMIANFSGSEVDR